jgi:hypothetical protein
MKTNVSLVRGINDEWTLLVGDVDLSLLATSVTIDVAAGEPYATAIVTLHADVAEFHGPAEVTVSHG